MLILSAPWDFRFLWISLSLTAKLYMICLLAAFSYSAYCLTRATVRIRQMEQWKKTDMGVLEKTKQKLQTLRELHTLLLLAFGLCCANEVLKTLQGIQNAAASLSAATWNIFVPVIAFAFVVFAALLVLHLFRWAVAHTLQSKIHF